jgi:endonuclease YncB( thermonuclease family)
MSARPAIGLAFLILASLVLAGCSQVADSMRPIERSLSPAIDSTAVAIGPATALDARTLEIAGAAGGAARRFQLYGIDAPDPDQSCETAAQKDYPCGVLARDHLVQIIGNQPVDCVPRGANEFDMTLAVCSVGRTDLAQAMIESGWAIADRPRTLYYEQSELDTRIKKLGLWQGPFVTPQEWRNGERVPAARSFGEQERLTP